MAVAFHILGPLRVDRDDLPIRLPAGRPAALLLALLVHPNQVIPTGTLVDELWGPQPPASAVPNLRTHVSQLRGLLPPADGPEATRLVAGSGGYRIRVGPGELDAVEFERLAADGQAALARGEAPVAAAALDRALALWPDRASAVGPVAGPLVAAALDRLQDRQVRTAEAWFACRLDLWDGDPDELIDRLRGHVAGNPLRERAWGQLMTALYRVGEPAAALDAFTTARRALAGELGVSPGAELRGLHRAVLRRDPALLHPRQRRGGRGHPPRTRLSEHPERPVPIDPAGCAAMPPPVPHELPHDPAPFVGRTAELAALRAALTAGADTPVAMTIYGMPGTGKSALAARAAAAVIDAFPDGQLYLDLAAAGPDRPASPAEVLGSLVRSLGGPDTPAPGSVDEARCLVRSLLFGRRFLLLLDNAVEAGQVTGLLPVRGACALLVTTRTALAAPDGRRLRLGPLAEGEAIETLRLTAGDHRIDDDPAAARVVVDLCERLPLAVRTAGVRLAQRPHWSVGRLADRLRDDPHRLDELAVRDRLASCYRSLGTAGAAFRRLGLVRLAPLTPPVVAALLGTDAEPAAAALDRLVEAQLVEPVGAARFLIPGLFWLYAAELAADEPAPERTAAVRRVLAGHVATAARAVRWLRLAPDGDGGPPPGNDGRSRAAARHPGRHPRSPEPTADPGPRFTSAEQAAAWLRGEQRNLLGLARLAARRTETAQYAVRTLHVLRRYLLRTGQWRPAAELSAVALVAAREQGDADGADVALTVLAASRRAGAAAQRCPAADPTATHTGAGASSSR